MLFLLLSIIFSALIYAVFTVLGRQKTALLPALICNYLVAAICALGYFYFSNETVAWQWLPNALILSVLFISIFLVMAKTTQLFDLATASVASKMSMIIPVIMSVFLFGDSLYLTKVLGLIAGFMAVALITINKNKKGQIQEAKSMALPFILFIGSGIIDSGLKLTEDQYFKGNPSTLFIATVFALAGILGLLYALTFEREKAKFSKDTFKYGIILGIVNFGSIYFLLKSLSFKNLDASTIFPINNVGIVALSALIGWIVFKQKLSGIKIVGLFLAISAVYLLSL